ncbi:MAG: hypothetical protein ABR929_13045, partial [Roseiarcus sp.]
MSSGVEFRQALSSFVKDSLGRFVGFQGLSPRNLTCAAWRDFLRRRAGLMGSRRRLDERQDNATSDIRKEIVGLDFSSIALERSGASRRSRDDRRGSAESAVDLMSGRRPLVKGASEACERLGRGHVFGLLMRGRAPLAL